MNQIPTSPVSRAIVVSADVVAEFQRMVDRPPVVPALALAGEADPNLNVFVVNFDGTGNDRDHIDPGSQKTLIARFDEHFQTQATDSFRSLYVPGIATPASMNLLGEINPIGTSLMVGITEGAFGAGVAQRAETALTAFKDFVDERNRAAAPGAKPRFHVHINAFSRGCASALILANRLHEMEVADSKKGRKADGSYIRHSGVLLDAVTTGVGSKAAKFAEAISAAATQAYRAAALSPVLETTLSSAAAAATTAVVRTANAKGAMAGLMRSINLQIFGGVRESDLRLAPTSAAFLHLTAGGETRGSFNGRDIADPLMPSGLALASNAYMMGADSPGAQSADVEYASLRTINLKQLSHTDVGGGNPDSSASKVVEFLACKNMESLGLPIKAMKPSAELMSNLTAKYYGNREMFGERVEDKFNARFSSFMAKVNASRVVGVDTLRGLATDIDERIRPKGRLTDAEGAQLSGHERKTGAYAQAYSPDPTQLLVRQSTELIRTLSDLTVKTIRGVSTVTSTPVMEPDGAEGLMTLTRVKRTEKIQVTAGPGGAPKVNMGCYFDAGGVLRRENHSRIEKAPLQSQFAKLLQMNGPLTMIVRQEKAMPTSVCRQMPDAKMVFDAQQGRLHPFGSPKQISEVQNHANNPGPTHSTLAAMAINPSLGQGHLWQQSPYARESAPKPAVVQEMKRRRPRPD